MVSAAQSANPDLKTTGKRYLSEKAWTAIGQSLSCSLIIIDGELKKPTEVPYEFKDTIFTEPLTIYRRNGFSAILYCKACGELLAEGMNGA